MRFFCSHMTPPLLLPFFMLWTKSPLASYARMKSFHNFLLHIQFFISLIPFLFCSYGAIRSGYGQHFGPQGGQDSGFPSPRSALGYPFPTMQNSYSSYHLGGYAPPCASPPKDGEYFLLIFIIHQLSDWLKSQWIDIHAHDTRKTAELQPSLKSNGQNPFFDDNGDDDIIETQFTIFLFRISIAKLVLPSCENNIERKSLNW